MPEETTISEIDVVVDNLHEYGGNSLATEGDVFNADIEQIRKLNGLSPAFKRKLTRGISKAASDSAIAARGDGGARSKQVDPHWEFVNGYSVFEVVIPPYNMEYLAQIYEISSPHYAAVNAKSAYIAGLGYTWVETGATQDVLDRVADDEKKLAKVRRKIEQAKREMDAWLDSANDADTFTETLMKVWIDLEATGNGYIEIGRKNTGEIGYIGHIPSITMRVRAKRDGFVQIVGKAVTFFRNFGGTASDPMNNDPRPNEIIHLKKYSPNNTYYGVPDIIAAKNALAGSEFADRFNLDYFEHKAVPRYVIVVKGAKLSDTAEQKVISFFRTGLKGKNHRTLYIPLPAGDADKVGFEMMPVEAGVQDASFVNYQKLNIDSILMAHRVPKSKLSLGDQTAVAAAADADKTFKEQVCGPNQEILEKKINRIFAEKTNALQMKLNELTLTDANTQSQIYQRFITAQVLTPNEVRRELGKPGLPGGDKVVELKPQQQAEARSNATQNDARARERMNNQPDNQATGRNPKGEGRSAP